ncbi:MAG: alpha/beta hydrolase [Henriciella sp.]|mgnify:CR=1 FL=1|nr:alpha/beta hydrolase [Henriciella sp.]
MSADVEQIRQLLLASRAASAGTEPSIEMMRAAMLASTANMLPIESAKIGAGELGGVRAQRITPENVEGDRTLLYFHGGGYVIGSPETHTGMVSHIADAMKASCWSMDYRLGPEDPFPAAIDDGVAAYKALLETGVSPNKIIISGDSAGGGTAVATAIKARDEGLPMPAGLALLSPWVNLTNESWSYDNKAERDPMITKASIDRMAGMYLNGADAKSPLASPVFADLSGLPPMLIQVGPDEVLMSDSIMLAERAGAVNVEVSLEIWPEMFHVFQAFYPFLKQSRDAIARIGEWSARKTS